MEHPAAAVVRRAREGETVLGYWIVLDSPMSTERVAMTGYDAMVLDGQHGLMGYAGILSNLVAIDAAHGPAGIVRVESTEPAVIGQALDAGARGVIVPLVNSADDAREAVAATRYPGTGRRSYGPMRSSLRIGPDPTEADTSVLLLVMIETPEGLTNVEEICAVDGVDGVFIGPNDLMLAVGGTHPGDPDKEFEHAAAVERIRDAALAAGIIPGIFTPDGDTARARRDQGFRFITIASDLTHLEQAATGHLERARG